MNRASHIVLAAAVSCAEQPPGASPMCRPGRQPGNLASTVVHSLAKGDVGERGKPIDKV